MTRPVVCVNAHDRCYEGGPCPLCEPANGQHPRATDAFSRFIQSVAEATSMSLEPWHERFSEALSRALGLYTSCTFHPCPDLDPASQPREASHAQETGSDRTPKQDAETIALKGCYSPASSTGTACAASPDNPAVALLQAPRGRHGPGTGPGGASED
jgi:hypothetical protein